MATEGRGNQATVATEMENGDVGTADFHSGNYPSHKALPSPPPLPPSDISRFQQFAMGASCCYFFCGRSTVPFVNPGARAVHGSYADALTPQMDALGNQGLTPVQVSVLKSRAIGAMDTANANRWRAETWNTVIIWYLVVTHAIATAGSALAQSALMPSAYQDFLNLLVAALCAVNAVAMAYREKLQFQAHAQVWERAGGAMDATLTYFLAGTGPYALLPEVPARWQQFTTDFEGLMAAAQGAEAALATSRPSTVANV